MKKSWIVAGIGLVLAGGAAYRLVSNKARLESELQARERLSVAVPVTVQVVGPGSLSRSVVVDGVVGSEKEVTILAEAGGQVQEVLVRIGQDVAPGTPVARLDAKAIGSQLAMARVSLANAKSDQARFENLLKAGAATQQGVDQVRFAVEVAKASLAALERQAADLLVRSPIRGVVTARQAQGGSVLVAGSPIATVSDLGRLVLRIGLTGEEVASVRPGQAVKVVLNGQETQASVATVNAAPDGNGRFQVELSLPAGTGSKIRPGTTGTARFHAAPLSDLPVIPRQALVAGIKDPKVYVVDSGVARLRKVSVALVSDDRVAVASGLRAGDRLILSGQMNLADGIEVKVVR